MNNIDYKISLRAYLNSYDIISKYNITNVHKLPKIKKIGLSSKVSNFKPEYLKKKSGISSHVRIVVGLIFLSFFGSIPKIRYTNPEMVLGNEETVKKRQDGEYLIGVSTSNFDEIISFLTLATVEVEDFLDKLENRVKLNTLNYKRKCIHKGKISYNLVFPADGLYEVREIVNDHLDDITLSNLNFDINIVCENVPRKIRYGNFLRNILYF